MRYDGVEVLMIRAPLTLGRRGDPVGASAVALPYSVTAAQIEADANRMKMAPAGSLAFLYAVLIPIAGRAPRQLRKQAAESEHRALNDSLTGRPNRLLFERLRSALADRRPSRGMGRRDEIDVDHFRRSTTRSASRQPISMCVPSQSDYAQWFVITTRSRGSAATSLRSSPWA